MIDVVQVNFLVIKLVLATEFDKQSSSQFKIPLWKLMNQWMLRSRICSSFKNFYWRSHGRINGRDFSVFTLLEEEGDGDLSTCHSGVSLKYFQSFDWYLQQLTAPPEVSEAGAGWAEPLGRRASHQLRGTTNHSLGWVRVQYGLHTGTAGGDMTAVSGTLLLLLSSYGAQV